MPDEEELSFIRLSTLTRNVVALLMKSPCDLQPDRSDAETNGNARNATQQNPTGDRYEVDDGLHGIPPKDDGR